MNVQILSVHQAISEDDSRVYDPRECLQIIMHEVLLGFEEVTKEWRILRQRVL